MGNAAGTYKKLRLMDGEGMARALSRMAREIVETQGGARDFALVGIRTRGVPLAQRLAAEVERIDGVKVPVGLLDITLYRDDLTTVAASPVLKRTEIPFAVEDKSIFLCDDVLFTGRTVRAALDALLDFGRPRRIQLAVLLDRGRRELPIEAQIVGKRVSTSASEIISVSFLETDGEDDVWLLDRALDRRRGARKVAKLPVRKAKAPARTTAPKTASKAARKSAPGKPATRAVKAARPGTGKAASRRGAR